jgi:thiosulfate dehydrogenase [quinone] large subunit
MSERNPSTILSGDLAARAGLVTLLVVQLIIGYEWLASGITKVASETFVSGLASDLKDSAGSAPHFYKSFLNDAVIPDARTFAILIEIGEILVGLAFIAAAILWLVRWARLSDRVRLSILWATMLAALGATFMAINFHLANGGNHPWLIPADGFDETIDVDSVLVFTQMALFALSTYLVLKVRRERRSIPSALTAKVPTVSAAESR